MQVFVIYKVGYPGFTEFTYVDVKARMEDATKCMKDNTPDGKYCSFIGSKEECTKAYTEDHYAIYGQLYLVVIKDI